MGVRVKDIMTRNVVTVPPDATLKEIAGLLVKHSVSSVPVCDEAGRVVGIISERDLLRPFGKTIAQRLDWWISALSVRNADRCRPASCSPFDDTPGEDDRRRDRTQRARRNNVAA
ncbi:CBS domain-containing protein [Neorhizobium sp. LMR1-1-1.1]